MSLLDDDDALDAHDLDDIDIRSVLPDARHMVDMYGHEALEKHLFADIAAGRLPHALILAGPEGVGKATLAFRLARYLLAESEEAQNHHATEEEAPSFSLFGDAPAAAPTKSIRNAENFSIDPTSHTFTQVAASGHPDLLTIERGMDEKKGRRKQGIDVEDIRKVTPFLRKTSANGGWRVVIVDDADTMNRNAQNAILKILEEPPAKTVIILVAHRVGAFLPTIRSRARVLRCEGLDKRAFDALLRTGYPKLIGADLDRLAVLCAGSPGRAVRLFEMGGLAVLDDLLAVLHDLPKLDRMKLHSFAERFTGSDSDTQYTVLIELVGFICTSITRHKAAGTALPMFLKSSGLVRAASPFGLQDWIQQTDALQAALHQGAYASLDRKLVIVTALSAFAT